MANYCATARTNYFKVKDKEVFKIFCDRLNVEMIEREDKVGFICTMDDGGSLPYCIYDEKADDHIDIDLEKEVAKHLVDREVAVFMEAGYEKFRYVTGCASAVNSKGEIVHISIDNIYDMAKALGKNITRAEY